MNHRENLDRWMIDKIRILKAEAVEINQVEFKLSLITVIGLVFLIMAGFFFDVLTLNHIHAYLTSLIWPMVAGFTTLLMVYGMKLNFILSSRSTTSLVLSLIVSLSVVWVHSTGLADQMIVSLLCILLVSTLNSIMFSLFIHFEIVSLEKYTQKPRK